MDIKVYTKSKWEEIFDKLKARLESGKYPAGNAFHTIDGICKEFKVSRITARRVLQELKNEGWILPIRRRGTIVRRSHALKEIFFIAGSSLIEKHPPQKDDFFVINMLLKGLLTSGESYNVKITTIDNRFFFSHLRDFINREVTMPAQFLYDFRRDFEKNPSSFQCLKSEIKPILLHAFEELPGFSLTMISYEDGIRLAVEHLIKKGHKYIAYITKDINFPSFYLRFKGFADTIQKHSLPLDLSYVKVCKEITQGKISEIVNQLLSMSSPPTAIVCASDVIAIHVLGYCEKKGICVPEHLAVTGFDNRGEVAFANPPLTTVDTKLAHQGRKAVELIMERAVGTITEPAVIKLNPELIIRRST